MRWKRSFWVGLTLLSVLSLWTVWAYFILSGGNGYNFWEESFGASENFEFTNSGQFGDSFGSFSALMAALAAAGALSTLYLQSRDQAAQSFRASFYGLLDQFLSIVTETREYIFEEELQEDGSYKEVLIQTVEGRRVFEVLLDDLRERLGDWSTPLSCQQACTIYMDFYSDRSGVLGHYFRVSYHLFKMADEEAQGESYRFARIVRAHLSNAELYLLAYNCLCGHGKETYTNYLREYVILNNIDFTRALPNEESFIRRLPPECFDKPAPSRSKGAVLSHVKHGFSRAQQFLSGLVRGSGGW